MSSTRRRKMGDQKVSSDSETLSNKRSTVDSSNSKTLTYGETQFENSNSSSSETEECRLEEMETDSEEDSNSDESQQSSESFVLPFFMNENKFQQKIYNSYLQNKSLFSAEKKSLLINKTTESVPDNFTPWWDSINATRKSGQGSSFESENGLYDSWFEKSSANKETDSWLCGPKPTSTSLDNTPQIEDIEVPSIYGNVSPTKGRRALKKERKEQRNKTTGKKWFDMKLPDVDGKTKMDMELLQMRRALDPKRFYKQNDRKGLPKYFQLGTVVDEGADFYSSRLTKKQRKQTLVEELMADAKIRQYNKRKYEEVQQKKRSKKFTKKRKA